MSCETYVGLERPKKIFTLQKDKIFIKSINIIINFKHVLKYRTHWTQTRLNIVMMPIFCKLL